MMMNLFSRNAIVGFSTAFLTVVVFFFSGGGDDWWWEGRNSNFTPEVFADKSYEPLFLSSNVFYGDSGFDDAHTSWFNEVVVQDWKTFLGEAMTEKDIEYFIIKESSYNDMVAINRAIQTKKELPRWKSKFNFKDKKVISFFEFLNTAKFIEKYCTYTPSWSYETDTYSKGESLSATQVKKIEKNTTTVKKIS